MQELLEAEACGILIEDGLETYEYFTKKLAIESLRPSLLVFSGGFRKTRLQLGLRRLVSLGVAAFGLILMAPLMALIALAIKLESRGPALFVQERVGSRSRTFRLLKFRTMVPSDGEQSEWVHDNENRITRVGRWLRKYRLDELPQFINILRGDMNLVGPRPHPVSNFPLFIEHIPYYRLRTSVRPGVTGWAQIRYGYANNLEEEIEKMRYDLYYIKHLSFWFDVRILFDTVKTVLFGRGSQAADADAHGREGGHAATSALEVRSTP
jgi:lipopolysaccharide/colanic/teichoic acid biosynthesis glycosyltransferase